MTEIAADGLIAVRATVNLPGLRRDEQADVNPALAVIQQLLRAQYLVPLPAHLQPVVNSREGK